MNDSPNWKLPLVPEIEALQKQRSGLYAHLYKKERNAPASADLAYLHPAKTATTGTACHHYAPILPFVLVQNYQNVPTNTTWPKLPDEYTHHQWLKS